jgi:hypothetical protein
MSGRAPLARERKREGTKAAVESNLHQLHTRAIKEANRIEKSPGCWGGQQIPKPLKCLRRNIPALSEILSPPETGG